MSENIAVPPKTWVRLPGTGVEVLIDGPSNVALTAESIVNDHGELAVQVSWAMDSGETVAVRVPAVTWPTLHKRLWLADPS